MRSKSIRQRILAFLLCLVMAVGMLPMSTYAEDETGDVAPSGTYALNITNNTDGDRALGYIVYVYTKKGAEINYQSGYPELLKLKKLNTDYRFEYNSYSLTDSDGKDTSYGTECYELEIKSGETKTLYIPKDYQISISQEPYSCMESVSATVNGEPAEGMSLNRSDLYSNPNYEQYVIGRLEHYSMTDTTDVVFNNTLKTGAYPEATLADSSGTEFHLMTTTDDLVTGAHYIIIPVGFNTAFTIDKSKDDSVTTKDGDTYTGVGCTATLLNGFEYSDYTAPDTIYVSEDDITAGEWVFTCGSSGTDGEGVKFRTSVKCDTNGKNYILKMGKSDDYPQPMFDTGGGTLNLSSGTETGSYTITHASMGNVLSYVYDLNYSPTGFFCFDDYWRRQDFDGNSENLSDTSFYIYTDAQDLSIETGMNRTYTQFENLNDDVLASATEFLLTYKDESGDEWALTVDGPKKVTTDSKKETLEGMFYNPDTGYYEWTEKERTYHTATTDRGYAWKQTNLSYDSGGTDEDCVKFTVNLSQSKYYLWLSNSGMFSSDGTEKKNYLIVEPTTDSDGNKDYTKCYVAFKGSTDDEAHYLKWDKTTSSFTIGEKDEAAVINLYFHYDSSYDTYAQLTDLSKIKDYESFIIVYKDQDGNRYVLNGDGNAYGYVIGDNDYASYVKNVSAFTYLYPDYYIDSEIGNITTSTRYSLSLGDVKEQENTEDTCKWWKYSGARFNAGEGRGLYLGNTTMASFTLDDVSMCVTQTLTTNEDKDVRIEYNKDKSAFYIRGNKGSQYLSVAPLYDHNWRTDTYTKKGYIPTVVASKSVATEFEIYVKMTADSTKVILHDETGDVKRTMSVEKNLTLPQNGDLTKNGTDYTFVGWSTNEDYAGDAGFLSEEDSCDLYDYYDVKDYGSVKSSVAKKYSLVGLCNPEAVNTVPTADLPVNEEDNAVHLYPIYAVRGHDTVVTADEKTGTGDSETTQAIVGISDWKKIQDEGHSYSRADKEKWLGKIIIEVYKDGKLWGDSQNMYFDYHNDDAVDLNIKFIDDALVKAQSGDTDDEKLYNFMSDTSTFPEKDQIGHFVIDCVYAEQGGSEDGLYYSLNWMTDHGGQLDNVKGGSTVKVYVTTKYNVKYYLDDELITESDWTNGNFYTTSGTEDKFKEDTADVKYAVTATNMNGLMDQGTTTVDGSETFLPDPEEFVRSEYSEFSYFIKDYDHVIPIAKSPESLVPEGRWLTSSNWELKNSDQKTEDTVEWSADYEVTGSTYGTGNTIYSYKEADQLALKEGDAAYTYHLYAYTDTGSSVPTPPETGALKISKEVTGNAADKTKKFTFTIELDDESINGVYGDLTFEDGVAVCKLKDGESVLSEDLPAGLEYTVTESDNEGYTVTSTYDTGTIVADETIEVKFINEKDEETPETGNLKITKKVTGNGGDKTKKFTFTVKLDDEGINGKYGDLKFTDGVAVCKLKDGESVTAKGLPEGIKYKVTERKYTGYEVTKTGDKGKIVANKTVKAAFVNCKEENPGTGDDSHIEYWTVMFAICAAALARLLLKRKMFF